MLDPSNPVHAAADDRLRTEVIIWLTTVSPAGQPQSSPVWFVWHGGEFLIFGSKDGPKTPNIRANPSVSLHLDGDGNGGGNVIFEGIARIEPDDPPAELTDAYLAKYGATIERFGWSTESLARDYPHVIRVAPTRVRTW
jgi:PPOX class probable F420-dependent enzyme